MKISTAYCKFGIFLCLTLFLPLFSAMLTAAEVKAPDQVTPGELFVIKITTEAGKDQKILLESEPGKVQFMGAVQGTPDIQMLNDSMVEIDAGSGKLEVYELKYLAMGADGSSGNFSLRDASGTRKIAVNFVRENKSRNYSWWILAGGIVLLLVGLKLWRYQKSSPTMMSTKSLFMNYEELEKARKMYFGDDHEKTEAQPSHKEEEADEGFATREATVTGEEEKPAQTSSGTVQTRIPDETSADESVQESSQTEAATVEDLVITPDSPVEMPGEKTLPQQAQTSEKTAQRPGIKAPVRETEPKSAANELKIELTDESGKTAAGKGEIVKVGRRRDNQLVLSNAEVSREHVMFFARAGKVWLKPLTSSNITRINGKDVKGEQQVQNGDTLNMGGTDFKIKIS